MNTLETLATQLGFNILYNTDHPADDPMHNDSAIAGTDIFIGEYDNPEFELISFFHEYGHYLLGYTKTAEKWNYNTLMIELECWNRGIIAARDMNILFSDAAIQWGYSKALSYVVHDKREDTSWPDRIEPMLWINRKEKS